MYKDEDFLMVFYENGYVKIEFGINWNNMNIFFCKWWIRGNWYIYWKKN